MVYAAEGSPPPSICTINEPCDLGSAIAFATSNPLRATVRMLPGSYAQKVKINSGTPITIIGTGATHQADGPNAFEVADGVTTTIRGLTFDLTRGYLRCDAPTPQHSTITLVDVSIREPSVAGKVYIGECIATLRQVSIESSGQRNIFEAHPGSTINIDRGYFRTSVPNAGLVMLNPRLSVKVTNSVFLDATVTPILGSEPTPSTIHLAFNSFRTSAQANSTSLYCETSAGGSVIAENNAFLNAIDPINAAGPGCMSINNVIYMQTAPLPGSNIFVDPQYFDAGGGDLRLKPTSPAINAAVPPILSTDHDFRGLPRPAGAMDVGAFEM